MSRSREYVFEGAALPPVDDLDGFASVEEPLARWKSAFMSELPVPALLRLLCSSELPGLIIPPSSINGTSAFGALSRLRLLSRSSSVSAWRASSCAANPSLERKNSSTPSVESDSLFTRRPSLIGVPGIGPERTKPPGSKPPASCSASSLPSSACSNRPSRLAWESCCCCLARCSISFWRSDITDGCAWRAAASGVGFGLATGRCPHFFALSPRCFHNSANSFAFSAALSISRLSGAITSDM
mmetsp:Transcript_21892/g.41985  ORF Transcript_21892/g.41985 Transcript_21892/m.41985 type:complete len:242 (+) Transcript_21892:364-1089(+)